MKSVRKIKYLLFSIVLIALLFFSKTIVEHAYIYALLFSNSLLESPTGSCRNLDVSLNEFDSEISCNVTIYDKAAYEIFFEMHFNPNLKDDPAKNQYDYHFLKNSIQSYKFQISISDNKNSKVISNEMRSLDYTAFSGGNFKHARIALKELSPGTYKIELKNAAATHHKVSERQFDSIILNIGRHQR